MRLVNLGGMVMAHDLLLEEKQRAHCAIALMCGDCPYWPAPHGEYALSPLAK